jgi:hypothetical protein
MSDSKVFMFPENGYNNNGSFGLGGWGGGILGFILGILLGNGGFFGNNGWGGNGNLGNLINNDNNTDLVMNAINGTDADVRLLATTLNADVNQVTDAIHQVQGAIQTVGAQNGMGFLQVTNALQAGNASLSRQLCECCCENRLLTTQEGYESRIQTIEQTNQLGAQADRNARSITDAIAAQTTAMAQGFCDIKERELQSKIETQAGIITDLRNQLSDANVVNRLAAMIAPIQSEVNAIRAAQPSTITLPNNSWTAVPTLVANAGADFIASYWANRLSSATTTETTPATA